MSVASTLSRPVAVYHEEQSFGWWVYALLGVMVLVGLWIVFHGGHPGAEAPTAKWGLNVPVGLGLGLLLPMALFFGILRMTTEVTPTHCHVWFGWVPTIHHSVPLATVRRVEVVAYRPIQDCGGWGVRRGRGGMRVLNARGNRGVRIDLEDGSQLLVGSQRPTELAQAIDQGIVRPVE